MKNDAPGAHIEPLRRHRLFLDLFSLSFTRPLRYWGLGSSTYSSLLPLPVVNLVMVLETNQGARDTMVSNLVRFHVEVVMVGGGWICDVAAVPSAKKNLKKNNPHVAFASERGCPGW
jgi:hypothetical protein